MFGNSSVIQTSHAAAMVFVAGLLALCGCRCLLPASSTITPTPVRGMQMPDPPMSAIEMPEHYSVFRPILPGEFIPPTPTPTFSINEPLVVEPPVTESEPDEYKLNTDAQSRIDELNRIIAELELQLEDARRVPPPIPHVLPPDSPQWGEGNRTFKSLPVINKPDVAVYRDELQDVRIEVADRSLFSATTWQLSSEGEEILRAIAAEVRAADPKTFLDIEGHTDGLMCDPNNPMQKHEISSIKTKEIMNFFVNALRWDYARIRTSSFGSSRPITGGETPEGQERNNRIEIVVRSE